MSELRDPDLPCDETCILTKSNATLFEIVEFIVCVNKFRFYNNRMYVYDEKYGIYTLVCSDNEWFEVAEFLSDALSAKLKPNEIQTLLKMLHFDKRLHMERGFDPYPEDINAENCIIDVINHKTYNHTYKGEFTSCIYAEYEEDVSIDDAPVFKKFCETSLNGDAAKIKLLLQIIGYICSNYDCAKKAFMLIGEPNSGKSKILQWICDIIGEENVSNVAFNKLGSRFNIAELSRSKVNVNAELSLEPIKDLSMFKSLVGGDRIQAEEKGKQPFTFRNKCKLLFAGNGLPAVKSQDTTDAFTSRLVILYFPNSIEESERDLELSKKLYHERHIIFSLAVNTLKELVDNNFKFEIPQKEKEMLTEYKKNRDSIKSFVEDMCELSPEYKVSTKELYDAYKDYCRDNCLDAYDKTAFTSAIHNLKNLESAKLNLMGKQCRGLKGIRLKNNILFHNQDSESDCLK